MRYSFCTVVLYIHHPSKLRGGTVYPPPFSQLHGGTEYSPPFPSYMMVLDILHLLQAIWWHGIPPNTLPAACMAHGGTAYPRTHSQLYGGTLVITGSIQQIKWGIYDTFICGCHAIRPHQWHNYVITHAHLLIHLLISCVCYCLLNWNNLIVILPPAWWYWSSPGFKEQKNEYDTFIHGLPLAHTQLIISCVLLAPLKLKLDFHLESDCPTITIRTTQWAGNFLFNWAAHQKHTENLDPLVYNQWVALPQRHPRYP